MKNDNTDDKQKSTEDTRPPLSDTAVNLDPVTGEGKSESAADDHGSSVDAKEYIVPARPRKPKKNPKKLLVALLVVVLVLAAAGAALYFLVLNKSSTGKVDSDPLAAATKFESPKTLIDTVEPELSGKTIEVDYADSVGAIDDRGFGVYSPPAYKVAGKQFASFPVKSEGTGYTGDSVAADTNYKTLNEFFKKNKFKNIRNSADTTGAISASEMSTYVSYAEYESANIVCAIRHVDASATELKGHVASVGCASKDNYRISADEAQKFYDIYVNGQSDTKEGHVFGAPEIVDGAGGYKRAVIYQEDASQFVEDEEVQSLYILYFQEPNSNEWKFFTGFTMTEALVCDEFDTDALKKAFKGLSCYDAVTKKDSSVQ